MAASTAGSLKSMAVILVFSVAFLSIPSAESSPKPPAPPPTGDLSSIIEMCVRVLFDPPTKPPPRVKRVFCRDLLRKTVNSFKVTGKLSSEYVAALKRLRIFVNNPAALNKYLCGLSPAKEFGCNV